MNTALLIIVGIMIYFFPTWHALMRKHFASIFVLNLFLGWTILGWIGALIWALNSPKKENNKF